MVRWVESYRKQLGVRKGDGAGGEYWVKIEVYECSILLTEVDSDGKKVRSNIYSTQDIELYYVLDGLSSIYFNEDISIFYTLLLWGLSGLFCIPMGLLLYFGLNEPIITGISDGLVKGLNVKKEGE